MSRINWEFLVVWTVIIAGCGTIWYWVIKTILSAW